MSSSPRPTDSLDAVGQALTGLFGRPFERLFLLASGLTDAAAPIRKQAAKSKPRVIQELLKAKSESDRRNYRAKDEILRRLIRENPDHFRTDSSTGSIVGLTHRSGFRIHMPRKALPVILKKLEQPHERKNPPRLVVSAGASGEVRPRSRIGRARAP